MSDNDAGAVWAWSAAGLMRGGGTHLLPNTCTIVLMHEDCTSCHDSSDGRSADGEKTRSATAADPLPSGGSPSARHFTR